MTFHYMGARRLPWTDERWVASCGEQVEPDPSRVSLNANVFLGDEWSGDDGLSEGRCTRCEANARQVERQWRTFPRVGGQSGGSDE